MHPAGGPCSARPGRTARRRKPTCRPRSRAPCSKSATTLGVTSAREEMHTRCGCSLPLSCRGGRRAPGAVREAVLLVGMQCLAQQQTVQTSSPQSARQTSIGCSQPLTSQAVASGRESTTFWVTFRISFRSHLQTGGGGNKPLRNARHAGANGDWETADCKAIASHQGKKPRGCSRCPESSAMQLRTTAHPSSRVRAHWWSSCHTVPLAVPRVPPCQCKWKGPTSLLSGSNTHARRFVHSNLPCKSVESRLLPQPHRFATPTHLLPQPHR